MEMSAFTEASKYKRDEESNAVLSVDNDGLKAYKKKKHQQEIFDQTVKDVDALKCDVSEIKSMLREILDGIKR